MNVNIFIRKGLALRASLCLATDYIWGSTTMNNERISHPQYESRAVLVMKDETWKCRIIAPKNDGQQYISPNILEWYAATKSGWPSPFCSDLLWETAILIGKKAGALGSFGVAFARGFGTKWLAQIGSWATQRGYWAVGPTGLILRLTGLICYWLISPLVKEAAKLFGPYLYAYFPSF